MLTDQEMLQYIDQNAEIRCRDISCILPYITDPSLRRILKDQKTHYQLHRSEASGILETRHGNTSKSFSNSLHNRTNPNGLMKNSSSLVRQMLRIHLSERVHLQHRLNEYHAGDPRIRALAEKQLDTVSRCIEQIRPFL